MKFRQTTQETADSITRWIQGWSWQQRLARGTLVVAVLGGVVGLWFSGNLGQNSGVDTPSLASLGAPDGEGTVSSTSPGENRVLPVLTLTLTPATGYEVTQQYQGQVYAPRQASMGFQHGGVISKIFVTVGQRVNQGDSIAQLDTQALQLQRAELQAMMARSQAQLAELEAGTRLPEIATAKAQVQRYEAQLRAAKLSMVRRQQLYGEGLVSKESLDLTVNGVAAAQADLEAAKNHLHLLQEGAPPQQRDAQRAAVQALQAQFNQLTLALQQHTLLAPFTGTITAQSLHTGSVVAAGSPVMTLVATGDMEAKIGVPIAIANTLPKGVTYQLQLQQKNYTGRLKAVLPKLNPSTQTQPLLFSLPSVPAAVPGAPVQLLLRRTQPAQGYWLPMTALVSDERGLWGCYGLQPIDDEAATIDTPIYRIQPHTVTVLHMESDRAFVSADLAPGTVIVATGAHRVVAGQLVTPSKHQPEQ